MRKRAIVIAAVVGILVLAGAGAVYAYDQSNADKIGEGVKVGGVDVSGMTPAQASAKLKAAVLDPLNQTVVVRAEGKRFTLPPERAKVAVDVDGSVRAAVAASREGGIFERAWRGIRGKSVDADVELDITYSKVSIDRLADRVAGKLDKEPVDAHVDLESGDVTPQESQDGRRVLTKQLKRQVRRALLDPASDKTVRARTEVVEPEVTTEELAEKYPAILIVDRPGFRLSLYKNLKLVKTYSVAIGAVGLETPAGLYHIQNKAVNPAWTMPHSDWVAPADRGKVVPGGVPENPLKARWLGIFDGAGIHGTDNEASIGTAASHGCVRMRIPDVIELYDEVPVGAPIYIA
jgi:lipoprotein-anchoring transpeptidase ErfK/SrfK